MCFCAVKLKLQSLVMARFTRGVLDLLIALLFYAGEFPGRILWFRHRKQEA